MGKLGGKPKLRCRPGCGRSLKHPALGRRLSRRREGHALERELCPLRRSPGGSGDGDSGTCKGLQGRPPRGTRAVASQPGTGAAGFGTPSVAGFKGIGFQKCNLHTFLCQNHLPEEPGLRASPHHHHPSPALNAEGVPPAGPRLDWPRGRRPSGHQNGETARLPSARAPQHPWPGIQPTKG